jgi:hypothetical protein
MQEVFFIKQQNGRNMLIKYRKRMRLKYIWVLISLWLFLLAAQQKDFFGMG